ncbi:restriction endonuclease [Glutamicibacter sp. 0426]|uniref:restriction endonuclease n=1 Tax=Glutamicibacter sp. 0426 TaxID=1913445 RepID=UPI0011611DFA
MNQVVVKDPIVILLASGDTPNEQGNRRGHLFEHFMAQVMHHLGYKAPSTESLNVTSEGVELDISIEHELDGSRAIAECKAYSSNISVPLVGSL